MKGPSGRLKHDVRRLWECPVCQRREHTSGDVVNLVCECLAKNESPQRTWMRLLEAEPKRQRPVRAETPVPPPAENASPNLNQEGPPRGPDQA